ncbi:MAG: hypothetical protein ACRDP7_29800 [Trebonia sp.]
MVKRGWPRCGRSGWRGPCRWGTQNRCGSRSPRPAGTHDARPPAPAWPSHDRSSTVFSLPTGADTTVTRAAPASRPSSTGRGTTVPGTRSAPSPAEEAGPPAADVTVVAALGRDPGGLAVPATARVAA